MHDDTVGFLFDQTCDLIVYNAVHHHVLGKYSLEVTWRVWNDVVGHCRQMLIFETGLGRAGLQLARVDPQKLRSAGFQ